MGEKTRSEEEIRERDSKVVALNKELNEGTSITEEERAIRLWNIRAMVKFTDMFEVIAKTEICRLHMEGYDMGGLYPKELMYWLGIGEVSILDRFAQDGDINRTMRLANRCRTFDYYLGERHGPRHRYKPIGGY